jgi:hypothetical protein
LGITSSTVALTDTDAEFATARSEVRVWELPETRQVLVTTTPFG